ncbi:hypothetical protein CFH99_19140 [Nocardioides aromaticivorans]|uniref:Uncharacterized protein n=1 Tax=Nocardioides aromaticivorans TaxID=200618 RepID=A0ABX7PPX5_9ACTN|nr:hypothetical protein [Nocardioides aromaticivorans]QSR27742.1 hypothetical protein CFH99_19140 [Nocardioides aromaticivorans]
MSTHENPTEPTTGPTTGPTAGPTREQDAPAPPRRTGWHQVNTGHLVMGTAFLGLVGAWALLISDTVAIEDHGWVLGLPWLVAGAVGLLATVLRGPRRHWSHDQWWQDHGHGGNHGSGSMHGWH